MNSLKNGDNARLTMEVERSKREIENLRKSLEQEQLKYINRETGFREEKENAVKERVALLEVNTSAEVSVQFVNDFIHTFDIVVEKFRGTSPRVG